MADEAFVALVELYPAIRRQVSIFYPLIMAHMGTSS